MARSGASAALCTVALVLAACPGGDDGANVPADAPKVNGDALRGEADPVAVAFTPVLAASTPSPVTRWVRGGDGTMYGLRDGAVVSSTDTGLTWVTRPVASAYDIATTTTRVFAMSSFGLRRSADGGATWTTLAVSGIGGAIVTLATTPTVLWVQVLPPGDPPRLLRSTDQGDSFTEITAPLPAVSRWTLVTGGEYVFASSAAGQVFRTTTGAAWDDLGAVPMLRSITATQAGTALAYGTDGNFALYRRGPADAAWSEGSQETVVWTISQRENGELVRVATDTGAVETSATEGASWTSAGVSALAACSITSVRAFDAAVLGVCIAMTAEQSALRLPAATTQWTRIEPDGLTAHGFSDVSFTASGTAVLATPHALYPSADAMHWQRAPFAPDDAWPITAIAVSPNGQRMFAGSTVGRFAFLDATGALTVQTTLPVKSTEHARQAMWMSDQILWVTTASDDDTDGHLLNGDPDRIGTWEPVNPLRNSLNPQLIQPAGFHAVEACKLGSDYTIVVGAKEWFATNNYEARLRVQFRLGTDDFMDVNTPYTPLAPTSVSCAPNGTQAFTVGTEFLFVGNLIGPAFHKVTSSDLPGKLIAAKFAPDNRLWVITDQGVFRSTAAVDAH